MVDMQIRKAKRIIIVFAVIVLAALVFTYIWRKEAVAPDNVKEKVPVIPNGAQTNQ